MLNKTRKELDKRIWPLYDLERSKYLLSPESKNLLMLVYVVTEHCLIGKHARRLGFEFNDICRSCGEEKLVRRVDSLLCFSSARII